MDLSLTGTGLSWRDADAFTITTKLRGDERLDYITDTIMVYVDRYETQLAVIEGHVVRSNFAFEAGQLHGQVRKALRTRGIPYAIVPPATLKKFATGRGNADKTGMALAALKRAGLEFTDDNACDSWWLRQAAECWLDPDAALLVMPQAQRDALAKVVWPTAVPAAVAS